MQPFIGISPLADRYLSKFSTDKWTCYMKVRYWHIYLFSEKHLSKIIVSWRRIESTPKFDIASINPFPWPAALNILTITTLNWSAKLWIQKNAFLFLYWGGLNDYGTYHTSSGIEYNFFIIEVINLIHSALFAQKLESE